MLKILKKIHDSLPSGMIIISKWLLNDEKTGPIPANSIPLMINIHGINPNPSSLKVNSAEIYLNTTDSHYHVRGTVTNMQHESKDFSSVTGEFTNKTTFIEQRIWTNNYPYCLGKTAGYDFDTGYTPAHLAQFRSMKLEINAS